MNETNVKSVYDALEYQAGQGPASPALLYMGKHFSYAKLLKSVDALADAFRANGVNAGDVITLCLPNIPQTVYAFYAAAKIGAACHFIHPLSAAEQVKATMENTNSRLLFVFSAFAENIVPHFKDSDIRIVSCSPAGELGAIKNTLYSLLNKTRVKATDYADFCHSAKKSGVCATAKADNLSGRETVALLNSGGTTGVEKTIELSSFAINSLCARTNTILNQPCLRGQYMMCVLPLFHGFGLAMGLHSMIHNGGCSVILPKFSRKDVIKYLKNDRINFMIGVPALFNALLEHPDFHGKTLRSIKSAYVGGDFVPQSLMDNFNKRMRDNGYSGTLYEGYGLTETVTVVSVNTDTASKEKTVGKPLDKITVAAFFTSTVASLFPDNTYADKERLPVGTVGELCVSGPTLMNGYYKDKETTAEVFFKDSHGTKWVRTGDCGAIDEDGYVVFRQRLKRIIKVSGENVFPSQIEQIISALEGVKQVCAYPHPDPKKGSVVHLAIESETPDPALLADLAMDVLKKSVYPPAVPKKIHILKTFPQTKFNKIDLPALQDQITKGVAFTKE